MTTISWTCGCAALVQPGGHFRRCDRHTKVSEARRKPDPIDQRAVDAAIAELVLGYE